VFKRSTNLQSKLKEGVFILLRNPENINTFVET